MQKPPLVFQKILEMQGENSKSILTTEDPPGFTYLAKYWEAKTRQERYMEIHLEPDIERQYIQPSTKSKPPDCPWTYPSQTWRNEAINAFYDSLMKKGMLEVLSQEKIYRTANIQLVQNIPCFPFKDFKPGQKGVLYHQSYLDIWPRSISNESKKHLTDHSSLIGIGKRLIPCISANKNFVLIE